MHVAESKTPCGRHLHCFFHQVS